MIAYFDTSAVVALLLAEPTSPTCMRLWDDAAMVVSCRLVYPEACAALGQAHRIGRVTQRQLVDARADLDDAMVELEYLEADSDLAEAAGSLAIDHGLRGYDAIHLAAALSIADEETVFVTGDRQLAHVASDVGLAVVSSAA